MTTPYLKSDLRMDEGLSLKAYVDPKTGDKPYTIGYGHTGKEVFLGLKWDIKKCEDTLTQDINTACQNLDKYLPWWRDLNDYRQDVLANMCFNMGIGNSTNGLLSFKNTLEFIKEGAWYSASQGMLNSKWARQVGDRAKRLSEQMMTGKRV